MATHAMDFEIEANGTTFRGLEAGPADGPLALLLHGFPDSHHSWRHLMGPLADAGYRAVAPAMRGYAPSDVPADGRYQTAALSLDAIRIAEALGADERAVLIGHDWGAVATYGAVAHSPGTFRRCVAMAVPPTSAVAESFMRYDQLQRSWYMFFFQNPLSDLVVPMDDLEFIARLWKDWSPGYDGSVDVDHVRRALGEPERLSAALGYYRAMFDASLHDPELAAAQEALASPTPIPTLYLHGAADSCFLLESIGDPLTVLPEGSRVEVIADAGHFLQLEQPEAVAAAVLGFLAA
jgi:pimeloyl-ACP methyl ester carboxylesterase